MGMAPVVHGVIYSPVVPALDAWAGPAEDSSAPFSFSLPVVWGKAWKAGSAGGAQAARAQPQDFYQLSCPTEARLPPESKGDGVSLTKA